MKLRLLADGSGCRGGLLLGVCVVALTGCKPTATGLLLESTEVRNVVEGLREMAQKWSTRPTDAKAFALPAGEQLAADTTLEINARHLAFTDPAALPRRLPWYLRHLEIATGRDLGHVIQTLARKRFPDERWDTKKRGTYLVAMMRRAKHVLVAEAIDVRKNTASHPARNAVWATRLYCYGLASKRWCGAMSVDIVFPKTSGTLWRNARTGVTTSQDPDSKKKLSYAVHFQLTRRIYKRHLTKSFTYEIGSKD